MDTLLQDLRFAARVLRQRPTFTLVAVLVVALGTTAVTSIFSVANTLLLRPVPAIGDPAAVVAVSRTDAQGHDWKFFSHPLYRDLRDRTRTLRGLAAHAMMRVDVGLETADQRESRPGWVVSGNYFDVLRVRPALGRFFAPEEDRTAMTAPVVVISHRFWQERMHGDRSAPGRTIYINGTRFTVIGIAPEGFGGTLAFLTGDIFVPLAMQGAMRGLSGSFENPEAIFVENRGASWLTLVGRLSAGIDRAVAQAELAQLTKSAEASAGRDSADIRIRVSTLRVVPAQGETPITLFMLVLLTLAALVLAIASTNVASMLLARGVARRREFVVRLVLGAGRARLVRQLLTESALLFALGGSAGVLATITVMRIVESIHFDLGMPVTIQVPVDGRVLGFTLAVSLVAGVVFGLVPALSASRRDLATALRSDTAGSGDRRQRARSAFVVGQLAMSVLLLVAAGLFVRAFERGRLVDPGYRVRGVVVASLDLSTSGYDSARVARFRHDLAARVAEVPGVQAAGYTDLIPLTGSVHITGVEIPGHEAPPGQRFIPVHYQAVSRDWFRAIDLALVRGRAFDAKDGAASPRVAIVSESFARNFWPREEPLGRTFTLGRLPYTVVGVARDARFQTLAEPPVPFMFVSTDQDWTTKLSLMASTSADPEALAAAIRREIAALDPTLAPPKVQSLDEASAIAMLPQRVTAGVTGALGLAGLLLAGVGLYGIVAYGVSQRTREIGVRMALGATPGRVVRMILRDGARLTAVGLAVGMVLALVGSRALAGFLFGVSPTDPVTLVAVPLVLGIVTIAATWLPAWRAARLDVAPALRAE